MDYELERREGEGIAHAFCRSGPMAWSATLGPSQVVPVAPGSYRGLTANGRPVHLTVRSDRTIGEWVVVGDLPDACLHPAGGAWFAATTLVIRDDGTFDAEPSWDGAVSVYAGGELIHWEGRIAGRFDTPTSVSGTVVTNSTLVDQELGPLPCSTQYMPWSASLHP
jgi:hypothetical protein